MPAVSVILRYMEPVAVLSDDFKDSGRLERALVRPFLPITLEQIEALDKRALADGVDVYAFQGVFYTWGGDADGFALMPIKHHSLEKLPTGITR